MPNWVEIQKEWETSNITFKDLAEKYGVKDSTIRSRKNREKWQRNNEPKKVQRATQRKQNVATRKVEKEVFVESDDLTDKQRLFCVFYIKSFNATMSAIKAGYSKHSAHVQGSRLLSNDNVATEIRRLKSEMQQGIFIDAMDVLNKYIQIAFADITDYVYFGSIEREQINSETGKVMLDSNFKPITYKESYVDFKNADEVDGTLITEIKEGKDGISVKLADKMRALDMLSKYFDLLSDNDRKRLQEEKLKVDTAKTKAEIEKIANKGDGDKPIEIMITRKKRSEDND